MVGQMSHANQVDKEVLHRLESAAERVARGDAHPAHLRQPTAQYLSRAHIPSAIMTARSLGRVSFGREHEHKPGIVVFVPEDCVELDELQRLNRVDTLTPKSIGVYETLGAADFGKIERVAEAIAETVPGEIAVAEDMELSNGERICNHILPGIILALEHLTHANLRWRGPGSAGRVQIDEELEGVRGFAAWIPPSCLPPDAKLEDIAHACGAEKQGRALALDGLEV